MLLFALHAVLAVSGVWSAWSYNSGNWNQLAPLLSSNGFDTVFYCAAYGPEVDREGLQECIDACSAYGIDVHAWVVMWKTSKTTDSLRNVFTMENRLQLSLDGSTDAETWLCPTDPRNVELMASICLDLAAEFPVKGIHLDYIRFAHDRVCFCEGCRERFTESSGICGMSWPEDCSRGGRLNDIYSRWRSEAITETVRAVRDSLGRINRVVELSAAVLPREREMNYFAQQWGLWLDLGLLDFVVPMNYTLSDSELVAWGESQLRLSREWPIPCGIITFTGNSLHTAEEISGQIETAEEMGFSGWVIFHLSNHLIDILQEEGLQQIH